MPSRRHGPSYPVTRPRWSPAAPGTDGHPQCPAPGQPPRTRPRAQPRGTIRRCPGRSVVPERWLSSTMSAAVSMTSPRPVAAAMSHRVCPADTVTVVVVPVSCPPLDGPEASTAPATSRASTTPATTNPLRRPLRRRRSPAAAQRVPPAPGAPAPPAAGWATASPPGRGQPGPELFARSMTGPSPPGRGRPAPSPSAPWCPAPGAPLRRRARTAGWVGDSSASSASRVGVGAMGPRPPREPRRGAPGVRGVTGRRPAPVPRMAGSSQGSGSEVTTRRQARPGPGPRPASGAGTSRSVGAGGRARALTRTSRTHVRRTLVRHHSA